MKYQLVLQWPAASIKNYEEMIWIENILINALGNLAIVDGHDAGSGEMNIFLFTDEPKETFSEIQRVFGSKDFMIQLRAAFRERNQSNYEIIWPPKANKFSIS